MTNSLLTTVLFACATSCVQAEAKKPNIVYIIADDLGYNDLSCYGQKYFKTPHLDKLAADGIRFTDHYSGNTVCAPARSSLMTGQDAGHTYIRGNGKYQLRKDDTTVAELLKKAGYTTGMVGKSCVTGNTKDPQAPHVAGFDYFWGTLSHVTAHWHYPKSVFSQGKVVQIEGNNGRTGTTYIQDEYTKRATEFIERSKDKPFMLIVSYSVPHASLQAPPEAVKPFIGKFQDEKSYKGKHYTSCEHIKATHAAMVTRMDKHVGDIVAKLKQLGLEENTVVSFTSDNGSHYEGGYKAELLDSNAPLRGGKRDLYEGGIRIPFIVKWPAQVKSGQTSDHPSAFWDFLPSACELANIEAPKGLQGVSYIPTLKGEDQPKHPFLYWEIQERGGRVALRKGDWKIVKYNVNKEAPKVGFKLFNLKDDVSEKNDLAKKHPEKLDELYKLIKGHRVDSPIKAWNFKKEL